MKRLANFALFQLGWFAAVMTASEGYMWLGPLLIGAIVALHLAVLVRPEKRGHELRYILAVGVVGAIADSGLSQLGLTIYPNSEAAWTIPSAPPWIVSLWILFAILPHHSLSWLQGRAWLAATLGAVGGPLSYCAGLGFGVVGLGEQPLWTLGALALEYALAMPLLLRFARVAPSSK